MHYEYLYYVEWNLILYFHQFFIIVFKYFVLIMKVILDHYDFDSKNLFYDLNYFIINYLAQI